MYPSAMGSILPFILRYRRRLLVTALLLCLASLGRTKLVHIAKHRWRPPPSTLIGFPLLNTTHSTPLADNRTFPIQVDGLARIARAPPNVQYLLKLLNELTAPRNEPPLCHWTDYHERRYASLLRRGKFRRSTTLIGIDLVNAAHVLPSMIQAIYDVVMKLGPKRFHVVIYENGSVDKTKEMIFILSRILNVIGTSFTITSSQQSSTVPVKHRIHYLAKLRNKLLEPLWNANVNERLQFDQVLFVNDVTFCSSDAIEILWQRLEQNADMSCGVDFKELQIKEFEPNYPMLFYDMWVARDMLGLPFYHIQQPGGSWKLPSDLLPQNLDSQRLYNLFKPVQVFSCWNGISSLSTSLFLPPFNLRFRSRHEFNDDEQSECFWLCSDMWKLGRGKIVMASKARVAYDVQGYERIRVDNISSPSLNSRHSELWGLAEDASRWSEKVSWQTTPPIRVASYPYAKWDQEAWIPPF